MAKPEINLIDDFDGFEVLGKYLVDCSKESILNFLSLSEEEAVSMCEQDHQLLMRKFYRFLKQRRGCTKICS